MTVVSCQRSYTLQVMVANGSLGPKAAECTFIDSVAVCLHVQMPYAGPGGLPPSMGQYGQYSQTPPYSYMNPQAPYFNPMGGSSYGGYPQSSSAYPNAAGSTGFSGNSSHQYGGHPKYQGYGNQGRFDSNLADMLLGQRSIIISCLLPVGLSAKSTRGLCSTCGRLCRMQKFSTA